MPEARLQKVLADAGVASRRAAEALIVAGRVTVNGAPASLGQRVDPEGDEISVDGRALAAPPRRLYLALHKPTGVTSTVRDRHATTTVLDVVPQELRARAGRLYPVGRLDRDSEGLLLLTNDGGWAHRILHPRHDLEREYAVGLLRPLTPDQVRALRAGIQLEEGLARARRLRQATRPETARLAISSEPRPEALAWYRVTIAQGWRRQLRRMFAAVDAPVRRLVRVRIGSLWLEGLNPGQVRELTTAEAGRLGAAGEREERLRGLIVSLDGPASSGKSTVGAAAARRLGYRFCDTGLLYRAVTWLALHRSVDPEDETALVGLVPEVSFAEDGAGRLTHVRVDGQDVTQEVREATVDRHVSQVARQPAVRAALQPRQRAIAAGGRIIMAGRDIGTVILPDADLKIYLDVSVEERARRRARQRRVAPGSSAFEAILAEMRARDALDRDRAVAPLRVPQGATIIRSDGRRFGQTVAAVVSAVRAAEAHE